LVFTRAKKLTCETEKPKDKLTVRRLRTHNSYLLYEKLLNHWPTAAIILTRKLNQYS